MSGMRNFENDKWQLFHTDEDRAEAHDVADQHPEKVKELIDLWFEEAKAQQRPAPQRHGRRRPRTCETFLALEFKVPVPPSGQYTYYPGTTEVPERNAANVHGVSDKVLAEVEFTAESQGVIFAARLAVRRPPPCSSRTAGSSTPTTSSGSPRRRRSRAAAPGPGRHVVGVEFTKERMGEHHESYGPLKLYVDEEIVAEQEIRTMTGHFSLCGEGLCIGYDGGDAVSSEYKPTFEFSGGSISKVVFDVGDDVYIDVERHLAAAMARD